MLGMWKYMGIGEKLFFGGIAAAMLTLIGTMVYGFAGNSVGPSAEVGIQYRLVYKPVLKFGDPTGEWQYGGISTLNEVR